MTNTTALFDQPAATPIYAAWAGKPRRGLGIAPTLAGAIIRIRPTAQMSLAVVLCAASGTGILLIVAQALAATA